MQFGKVSVIGAGTMGRGIASVAALAGYVVAAHDVSQEALYRSLSAIEQTFQAGVCKGSLTPDQVAAALERIWRTSWSEPSRRPDTLRRPAKRRC